MSERLEATLQRLEAADQGERIILVGSLGRAALLNDGEFAFTNGQRERDADIIDTTGTIMTRREFVDAAPIDALLTKRIRPSNSDGSSWGLYDPKLPISSTPEVEFPSVLLDIQKVEIPFAPGISLLTFGACGQLALTKIDNTQGKYRKHADQVKKLSHTHSGSCSCGELGDAIGEYHAALRAKYQQGTAERTYLKLRGAAINASPSLYSRLQHTKLAEAVRKSRGTPAPDNITSIHEYSELAANL
jgi:hypothetical protein